MESKPVNRHWTAESSMTPQYGVSTLVRLAVASPERYPFMVTDTTTTDTAEAPAAYDHGGAPSYTIRFGPLKAGEAKKRWVILNTLNEPIERSWPDGSHALMSFRTEARAQEGLKAAREALPGIDLILVDQRTLFPSAE